MYHIGLEYYYYYPVNLLQDPKQPEPTPNLQSNVRTFNVQPSSSSTPNFQKPQTSNLKRQNVKMSNVKYTIDHLIPSYNHDSNHQPFRIEPILRLGSILTSFFFLSPFFFLLSPFSFLKYQSIILI